MYMIFTIAALTGLIATAYVFGQYEGGELKSKGDWFFCSAFGLASSGGCLSIIGFLAQAMLLLFVPQIEVERDVSPLVSMKAAQYSNAVYVLGTGSASEEPYYLVYARNSDGSISPHKIEASPSLRLSERESLDGLGRWTERVLVNDYSATLSKWLWIKPEQSEFLGYNIAVPAGTISHTFEVK